MPGLPLYFSTAYDFCGSALGLTVQSRDGRPIKIEGNANHPASLGATNVFAQAATLDLYDPDRASTPQQNGRLSTLVSLRDALDALRIELDDSQGEGFCILLGTTTSPTLRRLLESVEKRWSKSQWYVYESVNDDHQRAGQVLAVGELGAELAPVADLRQAKVILSIDCDFLAARDVPVCYVNQFAESRRIAGREDDQPLSASSMSRLYHLGPTPTPTSAKADHALALKPSQIPALVHRLASSLGVIDTLPQKPPHEESADVQDWLERVTADLKAAEGNMLVLVGREQPPVVHALAYAINAKLEAIGKTQRYIESPQVRPANSDSDVAMLDALVDQGREELVRQGADLSRLKAARRLHLRYAGTDAFLPVAFDDHATVLAAFTEAHRRRFGFATPERQVVVEACIAEVTMPGERVAEPALPHRGDGHPDPIDTVEMWSEGAAHAAPLFDRDELLPGDRIPGPALIREAIATTVIEPGWTAEITALDHLVLRRTSPRAAVLAATGDRPDPVMLELFNNLFMNVAEQAGAVLQNTSLSVNIKERLDFSCAIFDAEGYLVANAPHVPVHLGAMGESVRTVIRSRGTTLKPGDVVALNNPSNGGTHLPDITVITPVFDETGREILFFVGSRGHHADIGGLTPGSTPPGSRTLEEEGVVIDDFLLVDGGRIREAEFRALLAGATYPARSPDVNVADVKAQVASNEKAMQELQRAVAEFGLPTVRAYMKHVMDNAEESVRRVLERLPDGEFATAIDDGAPLKVSVRVDHAQRRAVIDFTGTGPQRPDNFNAPSAVCRAVVLYCFRCLVGEDIPLNDGCLKPLEIVIPEGTFLSPRPGAAVVAGNTEVSQMTCNAVLAALNACASAQATMNNVLFGDATYQYYETVCGGTGAGPGFHGAGPIQTHMTNSRMTDPEILELRYPVRLEEFSIRSGSGGAGRFRGGDGSRRRIRFLRPMEAVVVASRRTVAPHGLQGGSDGAAGRQWVERNDGTVQALKGSDRASLAPGEVFGLETPGGGGWGSPAG